jgi:hypothetical protein
MRCYHVHTHNFLLQISLNADEGEASPVESKEFQHAVDVNFFHFFSSISFSNTVQNLALMKNG